MLNSFSAVGRLGNTPEIFTNSDTIVATFDIAINEFFKKDGELNKNTHWIPCVTYGRLAEIVGEFLRKGSQVGVRGPLKMKQWSNEQGQKMKRLQVQVVDLEFLSTRPDLDLPPGFLVIHSYWLPASISVLTPCYQSLALRTMPNSQPIYALVKGK